MKNLISKIKTPFAKDIFVSFSGTTISQLIPIFLAPVSTRLYTPSDFGLLGIYMGVAAIANTFATFQYSNAILLTKSKEDEDNITFFALFNSYFIALICLFVLIFTKKKLAFWLNSPEVENWLLSIPLSIIFTGLISTYTKKLNKYRKYKIISYSQIVLSISTIIISIFIGYFYHWSVGLLIGFILGQLFGSLVLLWGIKTLFIEKKNISINKIKSQLIIHKKFPIYSLPTEFLYNWTTQLPIYLFGLFYNSTIVGLFNYGRRMTTIPVTFITKSIGLVFAQRAAENYNTNGNCKQVYIKTLKLLALILAPPFLLLLFFGPFIFELVFGLNWREAGEYVQLLAVMFYLRGIASPLAYVFIIANKQNEDFIIHLITLTLASSALIIGHYLFNSIKMMLFLYALVYSLIYIYYLIRAYKLSLSVNEN